MSEKRKDHKGRILKTGERMGSISTGTQIAEGKDNVFISLPCRNFVRKRRKFRSKLTLELTMKQVRSRLLNCWKSTSA